MLVESRYNVWAEAGGAAYVFNGVSGAMTRLSTGQRRTLAAVLAGAAVADEDRAWLEQLVAARAIVSSRVDELDVLRRRYRRAQANRRRLGLTVVTSLGCNFDCPYCYEDKHPSVLRADVADAIIGLVDRQADELEALSVTWFGGEPLLGFAALRRLSAELISRCDARDIAYDAGIVTNGSLLTPDVSAELRALRVTSAQVTIDGPAAVHDRRRPRIGGGGTFARVLGNVGAAVDHLDVTIRVNLDPTNLGHVPELCAALAAAGLAGRVELSPALVTSGASYGAAPAGRYGTVGYTTADFADIEREFRAVAVAHGFGGEQLPTPTPSPCTAVAANDWVVGSEGELWKCWDDVGDPSQALGTVFDAIDSDHRVSKWLRYDPFTDPDCTSCVALPVCMGGCPHHAMAPDLRDQRCNTFRFNHRARVATMARWRELGEADHVDPIHIRKARSSSAFTTQDVPVALSTRRREPDRGGRSPSP